MKEETVSCLISLSLGPYEGAAAHQGILPNVQASTAME